MMDEEDIPFIEPDNEIPFDTDGQDDLPPFDEIPEDKIEVRDRRMKNWFWLENALFKDERLRGQHILVYAVLCQHADSKTHECFPSLATITQESRCSRPTVVQVIKDLVQWGYISKETHRRPGTKSYLPNTYTVHGPQHEKVVNEKTTSLGGSKGKNLPSKGKNHQVVKESNGNETNSFNKTQLTNVGALFVFFNISLEDREKHLAKYGEPYVLEKMWLLYHTHKKKPVKNPGGWLNDALREDWKEKTDTFDDEVRESQRRADRENREVDGTESKYLNNPEAEKFFDLGKRLCEKKSITTQKQRKTGAKLAENGDSIKGNSL